MDSGKTRAGRLLLASAALVFAFLAAATPAPAQQSSPAAPSAAPAARKQPADQKPPADRKPWTVRMSRDVPHTFTIRAKDASLAEITAEMGRLLKIPFNLSPVMAKQKVSLDFAAQPLDSAIRSLSPYAYIDYVAGGDDGNPRPLAVFLHAHNEPAPSITATVQSGSEALLIEGDTEDGVGDEEAQRKREQENPLRVSYAHNQLSVKAKKQPLTLVLFKVASELGIPFDLRWEPSSVVDVDISNSPLEQAVRTISPGVRLYYRLDVISFQVQPLRLSLVQPTQTGAQ
jgi:hypothetical protein